MNEVSRSLGANLSGASELERRSFYSGTTPAHIATRNGNVEMLRLLGELGANLNGAENDGRTPALLALEQENVELLRLLADLGAELSAEPVKTAQLTNLEMPDVFMMRALEKGHGEMVRLLFKLGVEVQLPMHRLSIDPLTPDPRSPDVFRTNSPSSIPNPSKLQKFD